MDDVLRYAGKRVIVTGAASGVGEAATKILVDLGAEVHTVDLRKPDVSGLASFTETDLREPDQVDAAVKKIGAIVDALFNCAPAGAGTLRSLTERVVRNMIDGSAIVHVASRATDDVDAVAEHVRQRSASLAEHGIRINCVAVDPGSVTGDPAWAIVFLNSPRASAVSGITIEV